MRMKHVFMVMSTLLTFWAMGLLSYATAKVYNMDVSANLVAIYSTTTGILAVVTGYIQKRMSDFLNADEERTRSSEGLGRKDD